MGDGEIHVNEPQLVVMVMDAKALALNFVAPAIKDGNAVAQSHRWIKFTEMVFCYHSVWDRESPTIISVIRFPMKGIMRLCQSFLHDDGYFVINFASLEDRTSFS